MGATKIATCCYCGTKAALVLRGKSRHELSCSQCGAPLRALKMLPSTPETDTKRSRKTTGTDHRKPPSRKPPGRPKSYKKRRKSKGLLHKVFEEIWDEIEDIFD